MKSRLLLSLFFALFITFTVTAQYCGNSGSQVCTPTGNLGQKYFTPSSELMCINRSQQVNRVVQIAGLNLNRISSLGGIPARWVRIDSILNLPDGLCWSTSDALNMFDSITNGCLKISGITNAAPGQYKLKLMVTIKTVVGSYIGDLDGVSRILSGHKAEPVYLRLVDASGITCPEVDTLQTDSNNYLPFATNYDSVAQISGKIFFDANQNGIYDSSETGAVGRMLDISTDFSAISNTNGDFTAYIPSGLHIIKPRMGVLAHTPDSIVVLVNNTSTSYTGNNIALTLTPNYCEGSLSIIGGSQPPRPGFSHQLSLQYHNTVSGSPVSQTILLNYNPGETYITAVPIPNTVDTATHVITWLVSNIASGASWQANVTFYTPASVPNGSINHYSATVNNSNCNSTNAITTAQDLPVRGSFDPNDKAASPAGEGPGGNIPPLSELTYTIRFQNTGTYQAETVKVMDTLSNFADVKSLKVLAASHNYQVLIKGNAVTFLFANINLPDSVNDEPNSHGYVQYKVKIKDNATVGTVINNTAFIYFDFNAPVVTNTTTNTLTLPNGITDIANSTATMQLYPNPAQDMVMINLSDNLTGGTLTLSDVTGRSLSTIALTATHNQLNTGALSSGVYLVTAVKGGERVVQRLVVSK